MVTEFETLDAIKKISNAVDTGDLKLARAEISTLKNKYQHMCNEFDKWADEQAEIEENRLLVES